MTKEIKALDAYTIQDIGDPAPKVLRTLWVEQVRRLPEKRVTYRVVRACNILDPAIDTRVHLNRLQKLIEMGVKVNIKYSIDVT